jgi:hypothetical protein
LAGSYGLTPARWPAGSGIIPHGAGSLLWPAESGVHTLEAFTYDGPFPDVLQSFRPKQR